MLNLKNLLGACTVASVDVVVPNYQYARFLPQCIDSVLRQQVHDLRVLIIDNASTDNSLEVAQELARLDRRIEVQQHQTNLGFHASVNEGLDWATSDYVMILCSDDFLPAGALARAVSILEANPSVAFAYGPYAELRKQNLPIAVHAAQENWKIEPGSSFITRCCGSMVQTMAPLVRTAVQRRAGYYRTELAQTSDLEILLRLACYGDVAATCAIQGVQRIHQNNISINAWNDPVLTALQEIEMFDCFFRNEGKGLPSAANAHRRARRNIAQRAYWRGLARVVRGQPRDAVKLLALAARLSPDLVIMPPIRQLVRMKLSRPQGRGMAAAGAPGQRP
jgi:glycosyltransferase involved in cell wall biosynthesis